MGVPLKNSLGAQAPAAAFRIEAGRIAREPRPLDLSDTMLAPPSAARTADRQDREEAAEWLISALSDGPVESGDLFRQARSCGISAKTLRRAGKAVGLKPAKTSFEGPWVWGEIRNAECGTRNEEERGSDDAGNAPIDSDPQLPTADLAKMANQERKSSASASGVVSDRCEVGQLVKGRELLTT